jgi:hypothetical protein
MLSYKFNVGSSGTSESGRIKMACVWKWYAYVFIVKAINQGKILVLDLYLQPTKIQN